MGLSGGAIELSVPSCELLKIKEGHPQGIPKITGMP